MFAISVPRQMKLFGIALAVPCSLFLTLIAMIDLPPVQADHHAATMPVGLADRFTVPVSQPSLVDPAAPADGVEVSIVDFAFSPAVITVTAGTVVTWTNQGEFAHTTTSDVGSADPWDSGILGPGAIFTRTFDVPGVFGYFCGFHPMQGTVVVLASQQAPLELSVAGPSAGAAERPQTFAATVGPITATQPVTYSWLATGQAPITHTGRGLSDTLAFTWSAADVGPQVITVTADNSVGTVSAIYTTTIVPPAGEGVADVLIIDFAFQPQTITISVGSSVRWINAGWQPHTTTSDVNSSEVWDSGNLDPGDVFTRTFDARGVYEYLCTIHPDMTGLVAVVTQVYLPLVQR